MFGRGSDSTVVPPRRQLPMPLFEIKANPTAIPVISTYISYRIPISNESC